MKKSDKKGNVLFIILIAVGLFAALAYTVSNSFRGGTDTISKEQARVAAGSLLRDINTIKEGYEYLQTANGCSVDEISFAFAGKNIGSNNFTARIPRSDNSCDIFHPKGAGVSYPSNLAQYQDSALFQIPLYANNKDKINFYIPENGAWGLWMTFAPLKQEICLSFNRLMGYNKMVNGQPSGGLYAFAYYSEVTPHCHYNGTTYEIMFPIWMPNEPTSI